MATQGASSVLFGVLGFDKLIIGNERDLYIYIYIYMKWILLTLKISHPSIQGVSNWGPYNQAC